MSFSIRPPDSGPLGGIGAGLPSAPPRTETAKADGPTFARVYALEEARRRRDVPLPPITGDRIPSEVWDEVDRAARLVEQLADRGQRVSFDNDRLTGKVVATLIDEQTPLAPAGPGMGIARPTTNGLPLQLSDVVDPSAATRATTPAPPAPTTPFGGTPYAR